MSVRIFSVWVISILGSDRAARAVCRVNLPIRQKLSAIPHYICCRRVAAEEMLPNLLSLFPCIPSPHLS
ncbi:hypothetical protein ACU8KH_01663 [Lachancea thermotolerans]